MRIHPCFGSFISNLSSNLMLVSLLLVFLGIDYLTTDISQAYSPCHSSCSPPRVSWQALAKCSCWERSYWKSGLPEWCHLDRGSLGTGRVSDVNLLLRCYTIISRPLNATSVVRL